MDIRRSTAAVVQKFQFLSSSLGNQGSRYAHLVNSLALVDEFGRFRVWSGNLGALQKGHSSLDYRLINSPLLSSNVIKLLKELEKNLHEAVAVLTGARLPYEEQAALSCADDDNEDDNFSSEDDDDEQHDGGGELLGRTELQQRFREVVDIVDSLYKLSLKIRQPTMRMRALKASSYRPKDTETGVDLFEQYAIFDHRHTQELVRHFRSEHAQVRDQNDDFLVTRLSRAITLRRRHFRYWQRHRDKLGVGTTENGEAADVAPVQQHFNNLELPNRVEEASEQLASAPQQAASEKTARTMFSPTEATLHHQSLDDIVDSKSVTSYATTVRDLAGNGVELPPPPKAAHIDQDFECPYCFIICPARYGKGRPWRTHILQDLQPYVCTYEDCESSEQLFRSRREWTEHESSHRRVWRCLEHLNAVFRSQDGLSNHFRSDHSDGLTEHQLSSIVKVGETSTIDNRQYCPICRISAKVIENGLQNHIANHLERIACFALPTPTTDTDSDGVSSVASRGGKGMSRTSQKLYEVSLRTYVRAGSRSRLISARRKHTEVSGDPGPTNSTIRPLTRENLEEASMRIRAEDISSAGPLPNDLFANQARSTGVEIGSTIEDAFISESDPLTTDKETQSIPSRKPMSRAATVDFVDSQSQDLNVEVATAESLGEKSSYDTGRSRRQYSF